MSRQHIFLPAVLYGILMVLVSVDVASQTEPARRIIPDHILYESLLRNLALIQRKADELDRSGGPGWQMKDAVCSQLDLGAVDCTAILQTAAAAEAQLRQLDEAARSIIEEVRRKHKDRAPGAVLPPPPQELIQLQAQRNSVVQNAVSSLKQRLTLSGWNAFTTYAVRRQDTITPPSPDGASNPTSQ